MARLGARGCKAGAGSGSGNEWARGLGDSETSGPNTTGVVLDRWHLRFTDAETEAAFQEDYAQRILTQTRAGLLLGAFLYLGLGFQDPWFFPQTFPLTLGTRTVVACIFVLTVLRSRQPGFPRFAQCWVLGNCLVAGGGLLLMISQGPLHAANVYSAGYLLILVWMYTFSGLRFHPALVANLGLLCAYVGVYVLVKHAPPVWTLTNLANLLAGSIVVAISGYVIEWQRRMTFHHMQLLDQDRRDHERLSLYDALTGLPNRRLFERRLRIALSDKSTRPVRGAVLFVDIDHFKPVNDAYGHTAGDYVLGALSRRIQAAVRREDTVARLGGDEFLILVQPLQRADDAVRVARQIIRSLRQPCQLRDQDSGTMARVSASVGIAFFPRDGCTPEELIRRADAAMYLAKERGRNCYCLFHGDPVRQAVANN